MLEKTFPEKIAGLGKRDMLPEHLNGTQKFEYGYKVNVGYRLSVTLKIGTCQKWTLLIT